MANRTLEDLYGVGPATLDDFQRLGIHSVEQLASANAHELYNRLSLLTGQQPDICCLDVFYCTIAQARDPELPEEKRQWWYWSRRRKELGLH